MAVSQKFTSQVILDSIGEGVYVTDTDRTILYWGKAAERITGWRESDVLGRHCHDGVLCHIDKDGHRLCGEEHCPLHRSMMTGQPSTLPLIVFAQTRDGGRVPLQASVTPLRNDEGEVIGGVETFRDLSHEFADIDRAGRIQRLSLQQDLPADPRIDFRLRYVPQDVVGGDYCAIAPLNGDQYGLLLADVSGHGIPAALYTMFLSSLWASHYSLLTQPCEFMRAVGNELENLIREPAPFAAAVCGMFDLRKQELKLVGAGNPPPLLVRADGTWEEPQVSGVPLGLFPGMEYSEIVVPIGAGDSVLFFTDGAVEINDAKGDQLGVEGLSRILKEVGYPADGTPFQEIEVRLLRTSDRIRFDDDITFLDVRIHS
ncbi:MAG: SpoIIE family protein phosphatase [Candidatus Angelobacter sp.]